MVPPDSHGISRAPCYLGYHSGGAVAFVYGTVTHCGALSHALRLTPHFVTPRPVGRLDRTVPRPRPRNACRLSRVIGLASSAFARHYSRNRGCFLFLWVLRCFTSPRSLYPPYIFRRESPGHKSAWRGFPIRKSSAHSSIISSPRLIADFYVLLRLQMPRHPPFALRNLTTKLLPAKD